MESSGPANSKIVVSTPWSTALTRRACCRSISRTVGAAYYVGNCHKWLCAPKGAGFLHVREDRRELVRPLTISHGANTPRPGRSRLHDEFDWMGTDDPTAFLSVPVAIEFLDSIVPGGWPEIMRRNRDLALTARRIVADRFGRRSSLP